MFHIFIIPECGTYEIFTMQNECIYNNDDVLTLKQMQPLVKSVKCLN